MAAANQHSDLDPAFEGIPFDQWLTEHTNSHFRWKVRVARPELSFHLRLLTRVEVELDGRDLQSRRGDGQLVLLVQITGHDEARYQRHTTIELGKLDPNIKAAMLEIAQPAMILPGDYQLAVAILDVTTHEHSTIQQRFRVAQPQQQSDFLTDAWRDLPAVEFLDKEESPDSWYRPEVQGRLKWATSIGAPARLNLILNMAPSVPEPGSRPTPSNGLPALLPTLKVLAEAGSASLSKSVNVLDLGRRRDVFSQSDGKDLDWSLLKASLGGANTATIDVHTLSEPHHDAQFFVSEVRRVLRASEKPSVLVVLTTPVAFESGEDLQPISLEALPPSRVFYIRYHAPVERIHPFGPQMGGRGRGGRMGGGRPMRGQTAHDVVDQLEATLKPLHPRVFDVETPEEMIKALTEIKNALLTFDGQSSP